MENEIYFNATKNAPPAPLLEEAILYAKGTEALEIGAGALNDSKFLLNKGWRVTAIDKSPLTAAAAREILSDQFKFIQTTFDQFDYPVEKFDLINAQWSLSFNSPETFDAVFLSIKSSLKKGGVFCGQFYGYKDGWANNKEMTFFTLEKVKKLFDGYEILKFVEEGEEIESVEGGKKHWHVFHVITKK